MLLSKLIAALIGISTVPTPANAPNASERSCSRYSLALLNRVCTAFWRTWLRRISRIVPPNRVCCCCKRVKAAPPVCAAAWISRAIWRYSFRSNCVLLRISRVPCSTDRNAPIVPPIAAPILTVIDNSADMVYPMGMNDLMTDERGNHGFCWCIWFCIWRVGGAVSHCWRVVGNWY